MPLIGGKNAKKKSSSSTTSKRHFTVVIGNKEHGLYVSSSPSSAARKAVTKLCATDKKKKVEFQIREITQGSKKKTYGPYLGAIEKLDKPIELKGRIIKYKPVAKLLGKKTKTGGAKKKGSVLVVQSKDGKISNKYITKKQADKHMKPRHKRLDKGMKPLHKSMHKGMKKLHKSMRGGGKYICNTKIKGTNHTFSVRNGRNNIIIDLYYDPYNNRNNSFSLKKIQEEYEKNKENKENEPPKTMEVAELFYHCRINNIKKFLNQSENKCDLVFIWSERQTTRSIREILTELVKYLPHLGDALRINDTFVDDSTEVDEDGIRRRRLSDGQLVEEIMSILDS
jgi:hypothetical protein